MAALRNLTIAIMKMAGHPNIAAATRHHARDATRPWPPSESARHDQNGHYATVPEPWPHHEGSHKHNRRHEDPPDRQSGATAFPLRRTCSRNHRNSLSSTPFDGSSQG
jgi:hypothetical protein